MANINGDGKFTSKLSQALSLPPAGMIEFFTALNIFLSITASLGNGLILMALHKVSSIHPSTKLFFRCLAVTDLCVGLLVQPFFATFLLSRIREVSEIVVHVLSFVLCGVSQLTSTAISVDRLLALLLGPRYRHVVTLKRARVVVICFWLICASFGLIEFIWWKAVSTFKLASMVMALSLLTSMFCYTRIHLKLRHQQVQVQNHFPQGQGNGGGIPLNIARYKKSVSTVLWVQLALVACYVPFGIFIVLQLNGIRSGVYKLVATTLVLLNSSLNPILYCWKIREVKQAVKDTIRQLYCF